MKRRRAVTVPHVRWIAALVRPQVRHAARYERVTEFRDNNYVQGTSLCSKWSVWQNGERNNDFRNLRNCGRCYEVLIDDQNAEEFFGRDVGRQPAYIHR